MTQVGDTHPPASSLKKMLRVQALRRRTAIPPGTRRHAALKAADAFLRSRSVRVGTRIGIYLAHASELDTEPLIRALHRRGAHLFVPVVRKRRDTMTFIRLNETTPVAKSYLRVKQPITRRPICPLTMLDIIIIPVVGFDCSGRRIGRGGGYYDRTLSGIHARRHPQKLGFAYDVQELRSIPNEPWDLKLDGVITERGFRRF